MKEINYCLVRICRLIILAILIIAILVFLGTFEIKNISHGFLRTMWSNFNSIATIVYILVPLIVLLILVLLFLTNRWAFRVEKMSIGGFNIIFDNPAKLYKRQIKNYLDTKRAIFKIDYEYDNFYETFDSYFEIYNFFRNEMKTLGIIKKQFAKSSRNKESAHLYALTNQAIQELNNFLTKHQSNYRRWYKYVEKICEEAFYLMPIGELQKEYYNYNELCSDFEEMNAFFTDKFAHDFDIDTIKWNISISTNSRY